MLSSHRLLNLGTPNLQYTLTKFSKQIYMIAVYNQLEGSGYITTGTKSKFSSLGVDYVPLEVDKILVNSLENSTSLNLF